MKRWIGISMAFLALLLLLGCTKTVTVHFETGAGSPVGDLTMEKGDTVAVKKPTRSGYHFTGWYTDATCSQPWNVKDGVESDLVLYAGWEQNRNGIFEDEGFYYLYDENGEIVKGEYAFYPERDRSADQLIYFNQTDGVGEVFTVTHLSDRLLGIMNPGQNTLYIAIGDQMAMLCDTFEGFGNFTKLMETVVGDLPYCCALTHYHGDHSPGIFSLPEETAIYVNENDWPFLDPEKVSFEDSLSYYTTHAQGSHVTMADYPQSKTARNLKPANNGDVVDLGGYIVEFFEIPGHTPGSIAILFVQDRMILTGDGLNGDTKLREPMSKTLAGYENLVTSEGKWDYVLVSHGGPSLHEKTMITDVYGYVREICEKGYAEGESASRVSGEENAFYVGNPRTGGLTYYKELVDTLG